MEKTYREDFDLPGLDEDNNGDNKYFVTRTQLDELYCILLDSITSTVVTVDPDVDDVDEHTRWRFIEDFEMLNEIQAFQKMPENQNDRNAQMLELLYEIVSQRVSNYDDESPVRRQRSSRDSIRQKTKTPRSL
jgi:hypothetical protein